MKKIILIVLPVIIFISQLNAQNLDSLVDNAIKFSQSQLLKTVDEMNGNIKYPITTLYNGNWKYFPITDWRSGFFPGCLWYAYEATKDTALLSAAIKWTEGLDSMQFFTGNHDIGFMIFCSYGNAYRLTNNPKYKDVIMQAAKTALVRYNPTVGLIKSWDRARQWKYPVIIDNMMNLELLLWSYQNGGDKILHDVAMSHAEKTMLNHFRPDGSTYHVVIYDTLSSGKPIHKMTWQGYADSSCWSRGQGWAVYGYTMMYRFTKDERFLKTAQMAADYFISRLPEDYVPYWDFQAPEIPDEPRDASAGALVSSALFELQSYTKDENLKSIYLNSAKNILKSLCSPQYLTQNTNIKGIINHSTGFKLNNQEVDVSLIYGDYYFLEAIMNYKKYCK